MARLEVSFKSCHNYSLQYKLLTPGNGSFHNEKDISPEMSERIKSLTIYLDGSPLEKILAIYTAYLRVILETQMFYKTDEKISLCEKIYKVYFKKKEEKLDTSVSLANTFTMDDEQGIIVAMTKKSNHVEETETPQT